MDNLEEAAQIAANRWKSREEAKEDIRKYALELLKTMSMTEVSRKLEIHRTSLYYLLYGRNGKNVTPRHAHDPDISAYDGAGDLRKSA